MMQFSPVRFSFASHLIGIPLLGMLYFFAGELGLLIQSSQSGLTLIWPASGVAFAVLFLYRVSLWPGIVLGTGLLALNNGIPWQVAGLAAIGSVLEAVVGIMLIRSTLSTFSWERLTDVLRFTFFGVLIGPVFSASLGTLGYHIFIEPPVEPIVTLLYWWLGNGIGILTFGVSIIVFMSSKQQPGYSFFPFALDRGTKVTLILVVAGISVTNGVWPHEDRTMLALFLALPVAAYVGLAGGILSAAQLNLIAILSFLFGGYLSGLANFQTYGIDGLYLHIAFMGVIAFTSLLLAVSGQEIRQRQLEAEKANSIKSEFLANMSHEIRTPLNAVLSVARMGARDSNDSKSRENFRYILNSGEHLLGVINDILDFSKIEAGRVSVDLHPFQLSVAVKDVVAMLVERATLKGLILSLKLDDDLPIWVLGDSQRLQQVLLNLLSNAIKFTSQGEIELSVSKDKDRLIFKVIDSGAGVSEEEIPRLFMPFEQGDGSTTHRSGSTGLGLCISKNMAKLMAGELTVESQVGMGSTFSLILPLIESEPVEANSDETTNDKPPQLKGLWVLVVDDVEINRIILQDLLEQEAAHVVLAEDGQQALDRLHELGLTYFDIVLMDIQMPVMDGYEATRQIQEMAPRLPIIALTAHALADERAKSEGIGMADHITKPVNPDALIAAIRRHVDIS